MSASFLPAAFLLMPFAEIAGFIAVGQMLGVWPTVGLALASSVLGVVLLKRQGMEMLRKASTQGRSGQEPGRDLANGAMSVIAALLLIVPGFITDILALAMFLPVVRNAVWTVVKSRIVVSRPGSNPFSKPFSGPFPGPDAPQGPVVDLDEEDYKRQSDSSSPWKNGPRIGDR